MTTCNLQSKPNITDLVINMFNPHLPTDFDTQKEKAYKDYHNLIFSQHQLEFSESRKNILKQKMKGDYISFWKILLNQIRHAKIKRMKEINYDLNMNELYEIAAPAATTAMKRWSNINNKDIESMTASFSRAVWLTITNDIMIRSKTNSLCIPHIVDINLLPTKFQMMDIKGPCVKDFETYMQKEEKFFSSNGYRVNYQVKPLKHNFIFQTIDKKIWLNITKKNKWNIFQNKHQDLVKSPHSLIKYAIESCSTKQWKCGIMINLSIQSEKNWYNEDKNNRHLNYRTRKPPRANHSILLIIQKVVEKDLDYEEKYDTYKITTYDMNTNTPSYVKDSLKNISTLLNEKWKDENKNRKIFTNITAIDGKFLKLRNNLNSLFDSHGFCGSIAQLIGLLWGRTCFFWNSPLEMIKSMDSLIKKRGV